MCVYYLFTIVSNISVEKTRNELFTETTKEINKQPTIPLILTHHPSNHQIKDIIHKNWEILKFSSKSTEIMPLKPLMVTRRNTNLKDAVRNLKIQNTQQSQERKYKITGNHVILRNATYATPSTKVQYPTNIARQKLKLNTMSTAIPPMSFIY